MQAPARLCGSPDRYRPHSLAEWASHRVPAGDLPDLALRVRRNTLERDVVIDGQAVTVDLRGIDPALLDLGSRAVTLELDAL